MNGTAYYVSFIVGFILSPLLSAYFIFIVWICAAVGLYIIDHPFIRRNPFLYLFNIVLNIIPGMILIFLPVLILLIPCIERYLPDESLWIEVGNHTNVHLNHQTTLNITNSDTP